MKKTDLLLQRLDEIGRTLAQTPTAAALIGLGSVGRERERLDQFSDLDFFVIVKAGRKSDYLDDLSWLSDIAPVAYYFRNTPDGYKLLYEDGVFCEFAVFEEAELAQIPFAAGQIVWKARGVAETIALPQKPPPAPEPRPVTWLLGEALTNLYVGLLRDHRGETLSAMRFIQGYAVDRLVELSEMDSEAETAVTAVSDPFSPERRYEKRHPDIARLLPQFLQGYGKNRQSARAILAHLDEHFAINDHMKKAISQLCTDDLPSYTL